MDKPKFKVGDIVNYRLGRASNEPLSKERHGIVEVTDIIDGYYYYKVLENLAADKDSSWDVGFLSCYVFDQDCYRLENYSANSYRKPKFNVGDLVVYTSVRKVKKHTFEIMKQTGNNYQVRALEVPHSSLLTKGNLYVYTVETIDKHSVLKDEKKDKEELLEPLFKVGNYVYFDDTRPMCAGKKIILIEKIKPWGYRYNVVYDEFRRGVRGVGGEVAYHILDSKGCLISSAGGPEDWGISIEEVFDTYASARREGGYFLPDHQDSQIEKGISSAPEYAEQPQTQGDITMSEAVYDKKALVTGLTEAKAKHEKAIAEAQKDASKALDSLKKKFLEKNGQAVFSDEPVLVASAEVSVDEYDSILNQINLLAGSEIPATALMSNPMRLLKEAGNVSAFKQTLKISAS